MKIKAKSEQAKKVQELFLNLLHHSEYKRLSDFAREHKLNYAVTHHRIHPQSKWLNLDHINHLVQLIDKRKKIELNGENVKIITQISN